MNVVVVYYRPSQVVWQTGYFHRILRLNAYSASEVLCTSGSENGCLRVLKIAGSFWEKHALKSQTGN